ncbi:MAG TPA: sigma-70 family RNA polymerase sigma factor [Polyangiaceae bacterium]|nr:sigma-70 family RNA polymerase sigma factor [Polyangiaceae bacterium]
MTSDEELMRAYVAGDTGAFDELFRRYAPMLTRVLGRDLSGAAAEDLVQQTFLQLHRARRDFDLDARLRPWLFTIGFNLKRELFRRRKRRPEARLEIDGRSDPSEGPRGAERFDATQALRHAMARIPEDQAEVIALHWLAGMPFPEVAQLVGASLSAVKVRAHRGYAALRAELAELGNQADSEDIGK